MNYAYLFEPYSDLMIRADQAFERMAGEFSDSMRCRLHCSDCCHAVFGLFLIEAVFIKHDFDQLNEAEKKAALKRCESADRELTRLEGTLREFKDDPQMITYSMAKARIRCPLLSEDEKCILYPYRPMTCRAYGIPTLIRGVPRVCGKSGFKKDQGYPTFNLDGAHQELFQMTQELLKNAGVKDPHRATLLLSVSKAIQTPFKDLIGGLPGAEEENG